MHRVGAEAPVGHPGVELGCALPVRHSGGGGGSHIGGENLLTPGENIWFDGAMPKT